MSSKNNKWSIDLNAVAENFQNAVNYYLTDDLIGIIFGIVTTKQITNVVFFRSSCILKNEAENILLYYQEDVEALGLARLINRSTSFSFYSEEKVSLKFSIDDLKSISRNLRKILAANPTVLNRTNLLYKKIDTRFLNFAIDFQYKWINIDSLADVECKLEKYINNTIVSILEKYIEEGSKTKVLRFPDNACEIKNLFLENDLFGEEKLDFSINLIIEFNVNNSCMTIKETVITSLKKIFVQTLNILLKFPNVKKIMAQTYTLPGELKAINLVLPKDDDDLKKILCKTIHETLNFTQKLPNLFKETFLSKNLLESLPLTNPHEYIRYEPMSGGICAVVKGLYKYYHYLQDNINDKGWGCAYRSFQTVWSWFLNQNFTDKIVPNHTEIQQCLVDINDKKPNFVGSKEWIGSLELSYCLENMLNISSRIISIKSSDDFGENARTIIFHFQNYGAPIMIGGGQYAYTIIGIDYDLKSGLCKFLILDPHYEGADNIETILKNGWCEWKPTSFWTKKCFYNLMLPINPKIV